MTEWLIEKLVPGGDGMARIPDGTIAFASGALPGDVLSPVRIEAKKGYVRAITWELVRRSPERVEPPCPIAARCGGCDWMALERSAQVRHKSAILREALERIGRFQNLARELPVVVAGPDVGYRSRVRFHIDADGRVGFFAKRSHELVEVEHCLVCRPEIDRVLGSLRGIPREALASFAEVEVRGVSEGGRLGVHFKPRADRNHRSESRAVLETLARDFAVTAEGEITEGSADVTFTLPGGVRARAEPGAFTQVNLDVNAALVTHVVEGAKARHVRRFLDLFSGIGNFTIPLLQAGMTGTAVERDPRSVESARRAARDASLSEGTFLVDDATRFFSAAPPPAIPFDLVLVDPPRRGAKDVLRHVSRWAPRHIAMCACDPVTLARDLATLVAAGYELGEVLAFDMFPHTHHLEALAWLERK